MKAVLKKSYIMLIILISLLLGAGIACLAGGGIFNSVKNDLSNGSNGTIQFHYTPYVKSSSSGSYAESSSGGYVQYELLQNYGSSTSPIYSNTLSTGTQTLALEWVPTGFCFNIVTNSGYKLVGYKASTGSSPSGDIVSGSQSAITLAYYHNNAYLEVYWEKEEPNVTLSFNIYTQNSSGAFEKSITGGTTTFGYRDTSYQDHNETITSSTATKTAKAANGYGYWVRASAYSGYRVLPISDTGSDLMYNGQPVTKTVNIYYGLTKYWTSFASTSFGGGTGSSTTPYLISTPEHLARLAMNVNFGTNYSGVYFKQTADLDLCDHMWIPIGTSYTNPFKGRFDGNGYSIHNMNIYDSTSSYLGLFGYVYGAYLSNINLKNATISTSGSNIGSIVGLSTDTPYDGFINCSSEAKIVSTGNYVGGLIGYSSGVATSGNVPIANKCSFVGSVEGGNYVGGIIGSISQGSNTYGSNLSHCTAKGNIKGTNYVGGIIGVFSFASSSTSGRSYYVTNCIFEGNVEGTAYVGGIQGLLHCYSAELPNSYISNCMAKGSIICTNSNYAGGILGGNYYSTYNVYQSVAIRNCSFKGTSNKSIGLFNGSDCQKMTVTNSYSQVNESKGYIGTDFSGFTVVPNMNGDLPMQNALFSVAIGGQTSEYVINHLKSKGFTLVS